MKTRMTLLGLLTIFASAVVGAAPRNQPPTDPPDKVLLEGKVPDSRFPLLDAMRHFEDKPDLVNLGIEPLRLIYAGAFWDKGQPMDEPLENKVRQVARTTRPGELVCIDIEHWPFLDRDKKFDEKTIDKYIKVAQWFRKENPTVRLGFYALPPVRNYHAVIWNTDGKEMPQWQAQNKQLDRLAKHVDVLFPSLYTFEDDADRWVRYAKWNIAEARRYGKPVYPFLMPRFHPSAHRVKDKYIGADFWKTQLDTCRKFADGVVIWSGDKKWDASVPWWGPTQQFAKDLWAAKLAARAKSAAEAK